MVAVMVGPVSKLHSSLSDSLLNIDIVADDSYGSLAMNRKYGKLHNKAKNAEKNLTSDHLSIANIDHADVSRERDKKSGDVHGQNQSQESMCFGCWSSGDSMRF